MKTSEDMMKYLNEKLQISEDSNIREIIDEYVKQKDPEENKASLHTNHIQCNELIARVTQEYTDRSSMGVSIDIGIEIHVDKEYLDEVYTFVEEIRSYIKSHIGEHIR